MMGIIGWLRSNLGSLILALVVGLTIWVIVNQEQNPVQEADLQPDVKITVSGLGDGLVVTNNVATATRLRLRAQKNTWSQLTPDEFVVTADLTGLGPGTHQVPLQVSIAARAILVSANPGVLRFDIEEEKTREIPIQAYLDGKLAVGYTAGTATIVPARVQATGPRSAVDLISEVRATIPVGDVRQTVSQTLPLTALDAQGNAIKSVTLDPPQADVTLPLIQEAGYRDVAIVARTVGQPDTGYYITGIRVVPDLITVRGDPQIVSAMQPYAETEPVNLTGLTSDLVQGVSLDLPPGVSPVNDQKIQMFVSVQALQGSRKLSPKVQIVGLGNGLSATFSPLTVDVILSGPVAILDRLNPDTDIFVTIDLTGLAAGVYKVEPKIQISRSEIASESIFPGVISVTIKTGGP
jgi:YbbR domain-containing protein